MYAVGAHGGNAFVEVFSRMAVAACVGLLIVGFLSGPELLRRPLSFLPFRLYGVIGYSVFLWHLPILTAMAAWPIFEIADPAEKFWKILAVGLPVTTIFGVVMYLLVERPFLIARPGQAKRPGAPAPPRLEPLPQPAINPEAW